MTKWLSVLLRMAAEELVGVVVRALRKKPKPKPAVASTTTSAESDLLARYAGMAGPPCDRPPVGWRCTRYKGHKGPCAAVRRQ